MTQLCGDRRQITPLCAAVANRAPSQPGVPNGGSVRVQVVVKNDVAAWQTSVPTRRSAAAQHV